MVKTQSSLVKSINKIRLAAMALPVLGTLVLPQLAQADETTNDSGNFWDDTTIAGEIRSYYFYRHYTGDKVDQSAYSLGGNLRILTGDFLDGFRIGAAVYTAQTLGLNHNDINKVDESLPGRNLTTLGQAYLQYTYNHLLLRGGDQEINTPWLNASDSRMIPATYRGVYGTYTPNDAWTVTALRTTRFKSRTSDDFSSTDLFNPSNQAGALTDFGETADSGARAVGVHYQKDAIDSQLWGYQFIDFAKLLYLDAKYTFSPQAIVHPFVGGQFMVQGGDGEHKQQQFGYGKADATAYGLIAGVKTDRTQLAVAYNKIFADGGQNNGDFGDLISPYTSGYATDPLYTTSMMAGLVEKSAGKAFKLSVSYLALQKKLQLAASFAKYYTEPYVSNTNETNFDVTYTFDKHSSLKGLSLRNRLGILNGVEGIGISYYERAMVQYSF